MKAAGGHLLKLLPGSPKLLPGKHELQPKTRMLKSHWENCGLNPFFTSQWSCSPPWSETFPAVLRRTGIHLQSALPFLNAALETQAAAGSLSLPGNGLAS